MIAVSLFGGLELESLYFLFWTIEMIRPVPTSTETEAPPTLNTVDVLGTYVFMAVWAFFSMPMSSVV